MYKAYRDNSSYIWPWDRITTVPPATTTPGSKSAESKSSGFTMAEKIGIGIGIACLCVLVILVIIIISYCCCSSMANKKQKVQPQAKSLPKKNAHEAPVVTFAKYPMVPSEEVYAIPEPRSPPPYYLPPIGRSIPGSRPPPYVEERYGPSILFIFYLPFVVFKHIIYYTKFKQNQNS